VNNSTFRLKIVSPISIVEKDIRYIRLKDETGFFGIMKGHIDFLTVIEPSLCYYLDSGGKEVFLAVDGGTLSVSRGKVTLTSRNVFESDNAEKLSEIIKGTFVKSDASEKAFHMMLKGIEQSFMEKTLDFIRGSS
jgi:F-type H+-transporting ATPase subunit epsilon